MRGAERNGSCSKKKKERQKKEPVSGKKGISGVLEANTSEAHTHTHSFQLFSFCVCVTLFSHYLRMEFPMSTFMRLPSLFSLSLHLSLFLYCCVASGDTVMCPPSVPPSLSLSLCPCHLQLLCETRHTAWGREGGREGETQAGKRGKRERQKREKDRQLYRQTEGINIWCHVKKNRITTDHMCGQHVKTKSAEVMFTSLTIRRNPLIMLWGKQQKDYVSNLVHA